MPEYNKDDIAAMQRDAIRRVREMQRRANRQMSSDFSPPAKAPHAEKTNKQTSSADGFFPPSFKSLLGSDSDKLFLILLILFLQQEGADTVLILALLYLMI